MNLGLHVLLFQPWSLVSIIYYSIKPKGSLRVEATVRLLRVSSGRKSFDRMCWHWGWERTMTEMPLRNALNPINHWEQWVVTGQWGRECGCQTPSCSFLIIREVPWPSLPPERKPALSLPRHFYFDHRHLNICTQWFIGCLVKSEKSCM